MAIGIRICGNLPYYSYTDNQALDTLSFNNPMNRVKPMLGLHVEIPLFNGIVYVAPEVSFSVRGDNRLFMSATWDTLVNYQAQVNYLEGRLPISIAIPAAKWFKPYVFVAPSFGVAMPTVGPFNSEFSQTALNKAFPDQNVSVDSTNMSRYDYGFTAGAGLRFTIDFNSFKMVVKLEGGYHMGFRDTYTVTEHLEQTQAVNVNAYNVKGKRLNRGIEGAITIAIPLDFHSEDDCFYWSEIEKKKNKNRGFYGF